MLLIFLYSMIFGALVFSLPIKFVHKVVLVLMYSFLPAIAKAETYHYKNGMVIQAQDYKSAAKYCFQTMTKGVYPGESRGLEIVDICANPVKGKIQ